MNPVRNVNILVFVKLWHMLETMHFSANLEDAFFYVILSDYSICF